MVKDNRFTYSKDDKPEVCPCPTCVHFMGKMKCKAFGDNYIPLDILIGKNDHTSEVPGDHGIRYKPKE